MKHLLTVSAIIELGAGLALLVVPTVVVKLLLGADIFGAGVPLGRVTGTALLALGAACWLARGDAQRQAARGLVAAMLLYNFSVVVVLGTAGTVSQTAGIALWAAVVIHGMMAAWCIALLLRKPVQLR